MSAQSIRVLHRRHTGETVYVVASGASVDPRYTPDRFWRDKTIVAVNEMWRHVPASYVLSHHHEQVQVAIDADQRVVTSDLDLGGLGWGTRHAFIGDYFVYGVSPYQISITPTINIHALQQPHPDRLVCSACTTAEAIQFAAHLGAASIVCCGMDGAALDGQWCTSNYNGGAQTNPQHCRLTQPIIRDTIAAMRVRGVCVSAHDPFVGYEREGHVYTPAPILEGRALITALNSINYQAQPVVA